MALLLGLALVIGSGTVVPTAQAAATTFTVNSANDADDATCDATHCSLREAINAANANSGTDTIAFNIPGVGPHTIQPTSALPTITDPVVIDGYTQSGASPNTNGPGLGLNTVLKIELDGTNAGSPFINGFRISAGNTTIRGLVINRFSKSGIRLESNGGNTIEGNFIGSDLNGTGALGNLIGVEIFAPNNTVGGTSAGARNVLSGNTDGILIQGGAATDNLVQGNLIGTDITGTVDLGNSDSGIVILGASNNITGGIVSGARNVISGNGPLAGGGTGMVMAGGATANVVQGNFIGTDVTGTTSLGNSRDGVFITGSSNNIVGGTTAGISNTISHNGGDGVWVSSGTGNAILGNSIFSNGGLGIDLGQDGVTLNDTGDADTGANNLQNFPVLTSATSGSTTIEGTLNSTANTTFRLEFFSSSSCDPSGNGEGETFPGFKDVTTDGSGNASFTANFVTTVTVGDVVTATATDPGNNTSEFSACQSVAAAAPTPTPTPIPGVSGPGLVIMAGLLAAIFTWTNRKRQAGTRDM